MLAENERTYCKTLSEGTPRDPDVIASDGIMGIYADANDELCSIPEPSQDKVVNCVFPPAVVWHLKDDELLLRRGILFFLTPVVTDAGLVADEPELIRMIVSQRL